MLNLAERREKRCVKIEKKIGAAGSFCMDQSIFFFFFRLTRKSKQSGLSKSEKSLAKRNATLLSSHLLVSRHPVQKSKFGAWAVTGYCSFKKDPRFSNFLMKKNSRNNHFPSRLPSRLIYLSLGACLVFNFPNIHHFGCRTKQKLCFWLDSCGSVLSSILR